MCMWPTIKSASAFVCECSLDVFVFVLTGNYRDAADSETVTYAILNSK